MSDLSQVRIESMRHIPRGDAHIPAARPVVGLHRYRDVVHLRADAALAQAHHQVRAGDPDRVEVDQHRVQVVRAARDRAASRDGPDLWQLREQRVVASRERAPAGDEGRELAQLRAAEGGLDVGEPVIEADL